MRFWLRILNYFMHKYKRRLQKYPRKMLSTTMRILGAVVTLFPEFVEPCHEWSAVRNVWQAL